VEERDWSWKVNLKNLKKGHFESTQTEYKNWQTNPRQTLTVLKVMT